MLWYLCCRISNYGDYGPLGYGLSCCGGHCPVSCDLIHMDFNVLCHAIVQCIYFSEFYLLLWPFLKCMYINHIGIYYVPNLPSKDVGRVSQHLSVPSVCQA